MKYKFFLLVVVIMIGALVLSGCNQRNNNQDEITGIEAGSLKTCAELNGFICGIGENCDEEWLDAYDTFYCCSCECGSASDGEEILDIELFDETPEDEDFGEVYE